MIASSSIICNFFKKKFLNIIWRSVVVHKRFSGSHAHLYQNHFNLFKCILHLEFFKYELSNIFYGPCIFLLNEFSQTSLLGIIELQQSSICISTERSLIAHLIPSFLINLSYIFCYSNKSGSP